MHKYDTLTNLFLYIFAVALYTSAWIEMLIIPIPQRFSACRTLHECID